MKYRLHHLPAIVRRHSPQGECGLKYYTSVGSDDSRGHSPQGECGLKSAILSYQYWARSSLPARGVRVEITFVCVIVADERVTPRKGSAG